MRTSLKKILLVLIATNYFLLISNANAVNWLQLQGVTEEPYPLVWGFLQPSYMQTSGTKLSTGPWQGQNALNNVIQPDLSSSQVFQIQRARVGIRGAVADSDKISYFILAEYGNNGITQPGGGAGKVTLTDATVTFSHIKGAKIRVGQMKVPMSEEVYQGIMAFNYINLTNIANQQLIERPLWTDGNTPCVLPSAPVIPATLGDENYTRFCNADYEAQFRSAAVAARDTGIQVFDSFMSGGWEHSYAVLIGQGGANKDDRDDNLDNTLYFASEKIFRGVKVFREGLKLYAWRTAGKRTIYDSATLAAGGTSLEEAEREYDRKLTGIGGTYFDGTYRFWAEYIKADGMIFNGSTAGAIPGSVNSSPVPTPNPMLSFPAGTVVAQFRTEPEAESDGGYLDFGYRIKHNVELDIRYDWYNRVTNQSAADEFKFETWTLGAQYFFSNSAKLIVNYEKRSVEATGLPSSDPANIIADDTDNRISAQVFVLF